MERLKDVQRRAETDLRKELCLARKAEEEAKRLNEEFKKKVRELLYCIVLYAVTRKKKYTHHFVLKRVVNDSSKLCSKTDLLIVY